MTSRCQAASFAGSPFTRKGRTAVLIIGRPSRTEIRIPMPMVLLTAPSLASISRGSPER